MSKIIGIDLGTTNSVVAVMEGAEVKVITNPTGARTTPSIVAFKEDGERVIGQPAKNQAVTNPENTVWSIKRFMGRRPSEVKSEEKLVPYKVVGKGDDLVKVEVRGKQYAPPEISAMILAYMKQYAEDYLGEKVTDAVITVPAYFNDAQRTATKEAGEIAGLKVRRILNEPTAAALAYGLDKKNDEKILIYDLGGGTFDVSVLDVSSGLLEVKATNGDTHLGGDDFDQALVDWIADEFKKGDGKGADLRKDKLALQRLREAAEKCKCELSSSLTATVNLPFIAQVDGQPKHLTVEVTRKKFELLAGGLIEKTRKPVEQALKDAGLTPDKIDQVVLVGGSTRIPAVQELVKEMFGGREPNKSVNPDEVVAVGAAIQAEVLAKGDRGEKMDMLLLDVTPLTLGIETLGGVMTPMIPRNTTIPISKRETFSTATDDQPAVDVKVYQGERKIAEKNRLLGVFRLDGIPPARKGVPKIEVCFDIDANGILNVTAKDLGTGKEQRITCQAGSGLSKADIERMKREAEQNAAEDEKRHALAEAMNKADAAIYNAEHFAKSNPEQLLDDEAFMTALATLKIVRKEASDAARIEAACELLAKAMHAASDRVYQTKVGGGSDDGDDASNHQDASDGGEDGQGPGDGDGDGDDDDGDDDDAGNEDDDAGDAGDDSEDADDDGDDGDGDADEDDVLDSAPKG